MKILRAHVLFTIALLLLFAHSANADLILLNANRNVSTGYSYLPGGFFPVDVFETEFRAGSGLADLGVALSESEVFSGFATLTTSVTSSSFMGSFSGSFDGMEGIEALGQPVDSHATSRLVVLFTLSETTTFSLSFSSSVTGATSATTFQGLSVGGMQYTLGGPAVTEIVTLDAGGYIFEVNIDRSADGLGSGSYFGAFSFNVIPGPGGLAILGAGLLIVPRRRRRCR